MMKTRFTGYSPDGKTALSGSSDRTAILWDLVTGECVRTFQGHTGSILSAAFSPDARFIITGYREHMNDNKYSIQLE